MKSNLIQEKTFDFGVIIIRLSGKLKKAGVDLVVVRQLLRSGISVGANVEEGIGAQSKKGFISKMNIAYKEARETRYWLRLRIAAEELKMETGHPLLFEIENIIKILSRILITARRNNIEGNL
jgi:four helix bundle protein